MWKNSILTAIYVRFGLFILLILGARSYNDSHNSIQTIFYQYYVRWDAIAFLRIAAHGFNTDVGDIGHFPVYPIMLRIVGFVAQDLAVAAFIIGFVSAVASGFFLQEIMRNMRFTEGENDRALLFMSFFPTAFFLALPYSDTVFMTFVLGTFYFMSEKKWAPMSIMAILAGACRIQGIALFPAILAQLWQLNLLRTKKMIWALVVPSGTGLYLFNNWVNRGDPFFFLGLQQDKFYHHIIFPFQELLTNIKMFFVGEPSSYKTLYLDMPMFAYLVPMILLFLGRKILPLPQQIFSWSVVFMLSMASFGVSMPRYVLVIFPMYIVLARLTENKNVFRATMTFSVSLFSFFATRYFLGLWAF